MAKQQSQRDDAGLLDIAANLVTKPLPEDRPLWAATFVPALTGGRAALVLVMHHVVGAGLAGLAVLRGLVDGSPTPPAGSPNNRVQAEPRWQRMPGETAFAHCGRCRKRSAGSIAA